MPDVLGWRGKIAVVGPSTNTIVQPDCEALRPDGVTNHYRSIYTPNLQDVTDATFTAGIQTMGQNVFDAIASAMTMAPAHIVMGMSVITFLGGSAGADAFETSITERTGRAVSMGSTATAAALRAYGGVRRIAFLSPYFPSANAHVSRYFSDVGFTVVRDVCLQCPSWLGIAEVTPATLRTTLATIDGDDVDAIVQIGTNLSMARLAAAAELWLGKPVIAINTATYWHALRAIGITDKKAGFGRLMEEF